MDWNYYLQKGSPSFITTCFSFCFYCFCFLFDFFGPMWGVLLSFHFPSLLFVSPSNGAKGIAGGGGEGRWRRVEVGGEAAEVVCCTTTTTTTTTGARCKRDSSLKLSVYAVLKFIHIYLELGLDLTVR